MSRDLHIIGTNGISRKTALVVMAVVASAAVVFLAQKKVTDFEKVMVSQTQEHLLTIAKVHAEHLEGRFAVIGSQLELLAANPIIQMRIKADIRLSEVADDDYHLIDDAHNRLADLVDAVYRIDSRGIVQGRFPSNDAYEGRDLSARPGVSHLLEKYRHHVCPSMNHQHTSHVFTASSGKQTISVCSPVFDERRFIGILRVLVHLDRINNIVGRVRVGAGGYAWVVDENGVVVAHPEPQRIGTRIIAARKEAFLGHDFRELETVTARMTGGEEGTGSYHSASWQDENPRLVKRLAAFAPVRLGDRSWSLAVSIGCNEISDPVTAHARNIFTAAVFIILVFVGAAVVFNKTQKERARLAAHAQSAEKLHIINSQLETEVIERRQAEEHLAAATKDWQETFDTMSDAVTIHDREFNIIRANRAAREMINVGGGTDIPGKCFAAFHGTSGPPPDCRSCECLRSGRPVSQEFFESHLDKYLEVSAYPRYDTEGKVIGSVHIVRDITQRLSDDAQMKKLSAVVNQSVNMICITDLSGAIEYVNPAFTRTSGYSLAEVFGEPIDILRSRSADQAFLQNLWDAIRSGQTWSCQIQNKRRDGEPYWERQTISPIHNDEGKVTNYLLVKEDITAEITAQQKLMESDKLAAVGMLAAGVSHEFKNYLGGIIGNASFALEELDSDASRELTRETLESIIEMGEKANEVAISLLSYSKAKTDDFSREDLQIIIKNTVALVAKELQSQSIELATYFEEVPRARVSAGKIQQLLLNLLINAEHAISGVGVITIALTQDDQYAYIRVGDTGCGINENHLSHIFDPFFSTKEDFGKDKLAGTGMGLPICRNIAREHGGELTVRSIEGVGTHFTLTLPLSDEATPVADAATCVRSAANMLVFSLDKTIMSRYFKDSCLVNVNIHTVDNIDNIRHDLREVADLATLDATFIGKVELLRLAERCREAEVPYVIIRCGAMDYQLEYLYDNAAATFEGLPEFNSILAATLATAPPKPAT